MSAHVGGDELVALRCEWERLNLMEPKSASVSLDGIEIYFSANLTPEQRELVARSIATVVGRTRAEADAARARSAEHDILLGAINAPLAKLIRADPGAAEALELLGMRRDGAEDSLSSERPLRGVRYHAIPVSPTDTGVEHGFLPTTSPGAGITTEGPLRSTRRATQGDASASMRGPEFVHGGRRPVCPRTHRRRLHRADRSPDHRRVVRDALFAAFLRRRRTRARRERHLGGWPGDHFHKGGPGGPDGGYPSVVA